MSDPDKAMDLDNHPCGRLSKSWFQLSLILAALSEDMRRRVQKE